MNDQTIPADKVRTILDEWERIKEHADWDDIDNLVQDVRALLPTPPRPTLADITEGERVACQWMQADVANRRVRYVIVNPHDRHGDAVVISDDGDMGWLPPDMVTPRPDLPPLSWPGTEKPAPAPALPEGWRLADHHRIGRVIVTNPTPNQGGHVYFVTSDECVPRGSGWGFCTPDELTYLDTDQEDDTPTGPNTLAVGTVIESADDPRIAALPDGSVLLDREGEATAKRNHSWRGAGYTPVPSQGVEFGPWAVVRIPKEADQ